jgi:hypothetical protein
MRRIHLAFFGVMTPALLMSLALVGCNSSTSPPAATGGGTTETPKTTTVEWKAIEPGKAVLKGKATAGGGRPDALIKKAEEERLSAINAKADAKDFCLTGMHEGKTAKPLTELEKEQQGYRVDAKGDVENVVVWIEPVDQKSTYFKIDPAKKTWPDKVTVDQPHCAFLPHVSILFPAYRDVDPKDPKKTKIVETGQKVEVINNAPVAHNTKWGNDGDISGGNQNLSPGQPYPLEITKSSKDPVKLACNIHGWMDAYIWALDTPYAAKTGEDGTYEIKGLPTGKFKIFAWHEKADNGHYLTSPKGDDIEIKDETTTKDFSVTFPK